MPSGTPKSTVAPATPPTKPVIVDPRTSWKDQKYYSLLTSHSLFSKKVTTEHWNKAQNRIVKLLEDESTSFQLYVDLLYTGRIAVVADSPSDDKFDQRERLALAKLYIRAEKLKDTGAKDKMMMAVLKSCEESRSDGLSYSPSFNFVQIIYQGTLPDSSMRRFLAELYSANADRSWPEYRHKYPAELVEELLISVLDRQARPSGMIDWRDIEAAPFMES